MCVGGADVLEVSARGERDRRRAISAADRNDLSWRNRVAAWEGALQMMAERPWLGLGWNQPDPFYRHYYFTSRMDETGAVQLNDYLMLGATLGIPALFCFCMYLWLAITQKLEHSPPLALPRKSEMLQSWIGSKRSAAPGRWCWRWGFGLMAGFLNCPQRRRFGFCWSLAAKIEEQDGRTTKYAKYAKASPIKKLVFL